METKQEVRRLGAMFEQEISMCNGTKGLHFTLLSPNKSFLSRGLIPKMLHLPGDPTAATAYRVAILLFNCPSCFMHDTCARALA